MKNEVFNIDCIEGMKNYPDKYFDLAVVDPPYGINRDGHFQKSNHWNNYEKKDWDKKIPQKKYFDELFRISKNQIIWGGNYFAEYLPKSMGWIVWDKGQRNLTMSDGELAFTSFNKRLVITEIFRIKIGEYGGYIHPTQKPVKLYDWIFHNYSEPGQKIIDTHLGSGSSRIAADKYGLEFVGFELDPEYFQKAEKRFQDYKRQLKLF